MKLLFSFYLIHRMKQITCNYTFVRSKIKGTIMFKGVCDVNADESYPNK